MYVIEVGLFNAQPIRLESVTAPVIGQHGCLVITHAEGVIVYAAGRWSGYTAKVKGE